jgi:quercetin dioxygenase-like cupin family protein
MITRRRLLTTSAATVAVAAAEPARADTATAPTRGRNETMEIIRSGSQPSRKGPAENFTGAVRLDPLLRAPDPANFNCGSVTFEPGARTAWHTHPLGQVLIITSGLGWVQREGGPIEEVRSGDVVWFPPGEKHWHGATPTTAMTHIAIQEWLNGKNVDWLENVSDEQYRR